MEKLKAFLRDIANETSGFALEEPLRPGPESIVAIVLITRRVQQERDYITLSEAGDRVSIQDTGNIDKVTVSNNSDRPIFIPAAWMLGGETQARMVAQSVVVLPGEARNISVVCVQENRAISPGVTLTPGNVGPRSVEQRLYPYGRTRGNTCQNEVWDIVREYGGKVLPTDEADNLIDAHSRHIRAMETVISQLPEVPNQVGFAILVPKGVGSLECFDLPDSWKVMGKSLIEKEVEALEQKRDDFASIFPYKSKQAYSVLRAFLQRQFVAETIVSGPNWETTGISAIDYTGEVTILDGTIIHVSLGRKEY